jgi:hypothetical protein
MKLQTKYSMVNERMEHHENLFLIECWLLQIPMYLVRKSIFHDDDDDRLRIDDEQLSQHEIVDEIMIGWICGWVKEKNDLLKQ